VDVTDCSPVTVILESVTSNEPDDGIGDGNHEPDIVGADVGTEDYDFKVRAERSGTGMGRMYTVVYRVTDAGGLETLATATVRVPHDQGP
jgi:endo-1,4-beta-xylanase